jgi:DNA-binding MarR family transcriptional regulator
MAQRRGRCQYCIIESFLKSFFASLQSYIIYVMLVPERRIDMNHIRTLCGPRKPSLEGRVKNGLELWQTEMPKLDSSGKAVCGRVVALGSVLTQLFNDVLSVHSLSYPEYGVLATLRATGAPFSMTQKQLLEMILFSSGGMSNLLARLEKRDLVERSNDENDRRIVHVRLTEKGVEIAGDAMALQSRAENALSATLSDAERKALISALAKLLEAAPYL